MFRFSQRSLDRLEGVHPDLVSLITEALKYSLIDFGVTEGLRSVERQKMLFEANKSKTMNSKHLKQEDGWGHAVDLVPYIGAHASYNWKHVFDMTFAIQRTLKARPAEDGLALAYPLIRWGGAWTLLNTVRDPRQLQQDYIESCRVRGRKPFLDGPHFEIINPR